MTLENFVAFCWHDPTVAGVKAVNLQLMFYGIPLQTTAADLAAWAKSVPSGRRIMLLNGLPLWDRNNLMPWSTSDSITALRNWLRAIAAAPLDFIAIDDEQTFDANAAKIIANPVWAQICLNCGFSPVKAIGTEFSIVSQAAAALRRNSCLSSFQSGNEALSLPYRYPYVIDLNGHGSPCLQLSGNVATPAFYANPQQLAQFQRTPDGSTPDWSTPMPILIWQAWNATAYRNCNTVQIIPWYCHASASGFKDVAWWKEMVLHTLIRCQTRKLLFWNPNPETPAQDNQAMSDVITDYESQAKGALFLQKTYGDAALPRWDSPSLVSGPLYLNGKLTYRVAVAKPCTVIVGGVEMEVAGNSWITLEA